MTAADGISRWRDSENVGEAGGSRRCAEQDEVRRDAFGGASTNDAIMLREIGDEHSDEDQAALRSVMVSMLRRPQGLHGHGQLEELGLLEGFALGDARPEEFRLHRNGTRCSQLEEVDS